MLHVTSSSSCQLKILIFLQRSASIWKEHGQCPIGHVQCTWIDRSVNPFRIASVCDNLYTSNTISSSAWLIIYIEIFILILNVVVVPIETLLVGVCTNMQWKRETQSPARYTYNFSDESSHIFIRTHVHSYYLVSRFCKIYSKYFVKTIFLTSSSTIVYNYRLQYSFSLIYYAYCTCMLHFTYFETV